MFLDFEKGHWLSAHRARFEGPVPPVEMRVQTRFAPRDRARPDDAPAYPGYPSPFVWKLLRARLAMFLPR